MVSKGNTESLLLSIMGNCVTAQTLVDQLIEGVLTIGPRFPPHDWTSLVVHTSSAPGDVLPVRLHVALWSRKRKRVDHRPRGDDMTIAEGSRDLPDLLEVGGESVHVLIVRQQRLSLRPEKVHIPDAKQSKQDRSVLLQRSIEEVLILRSRGCWVSTVSSPP